MFLPYFILYFFIVVITNYYMLIISLLLLECKFPEGKSFSCVVGYYVLWLEQRLSPHTQWLHIEQMKR